ncbi:hypothetical protein Tco_0016508 [Tanacetum coccineum]
MANIRTCNKHNMIACVEKTAHNADFYQIIDYLTGCSINYSLLVDPDLIGPWLQQFWATASLRVINECLQNHICLHGAMVAGKRVLISEETIRADLLFDDADGVDCFPKQVIWDSLRDIGYEGNLAQLTFSKPLFSPQWKYLVHVLLHCLSPKSTSTGTIWTNIASAPVTLPSKVFTFMRKHSPKFSCRITPLTPPMLEIVTALAAEEAHSTSPLFRAASSPRDDQSTWYCEVQGTTDFQGMAKTQGAANIPKSPNDYTPTDASQTSGGDEGLLDLYALNRENLQKQKRRRKKQRKKVTSVKLGRNNDEGNLSEEHHDQDDEGFDATVTPDFERKCDETEALERKSDETEHVNIEEEKDASDMKSPSSQIHQTQEEEPKEQFNDDEILADIIFNRPRGLSIPGPIQSQPQQPTQSTDPKDKGKEILVEEPKKKKLTLQQIRALETKKMRGKLLESSSRMGCRRRGEKVGSFDRRLPNQAILKKLHRLYKKRILMSFLKRVKDTKKEKQMLQERDAKRLLRKRKATITEEQPSKKLKLRTETIDELRNYLRIVDFEKSAQDRESLEAISMITEFKTGSNQSLYLVVQDYYKHIPPTGLGLILLGDLTTIWETSATSNDDFWKNQEDLEIKRRYPLSRELMIRMLDHGMEVEEESDIAITLIHLFILWTTEDGDDS